MTDNKKHILVLPFPAFGHITPMLELSKKIAQFHHVTFVLSESKLAEIRRRELISPDEEKLVRLVGLPDGLDEDYDKELHPRVMLQILNQMVPAQQAFIEKMPIDGEKNGYLDLDPIDAVIVDSIYNAPVPLITARGIPAYVFCCAAAWTVVGMFVIDEDTPTRPDKEVFEFATSEEERKNFGAEVSASLKTWVLGCSSAMTKSKAILINSFEDIEPEAKGLVSCLSPATAHVPVLFVGPLLPLPKATASQMTTGQFVKRWLEKQDDRSVVYVSFGSHAIPLSQQIVEIAKTLVELKRPFIWSLRTTQHHHLPSDIRDSVAKQFESVDVPYLILNWAPQKTILEHRATRLFVTHCGWNSTMEGISSGVPFVAWPMFADQHMNGDMVVKLGVGFMIPDISVRGHRIVTQSEMTEAIEKVASDGASGKVFYAAAQTLSRKAKEAIADGGKSTIDFEGFIKF